jgi:hypothetical protein
MKIARRLQTIPMAVALLMLPAASARADTIYNFAGTGTAFGPFPAEPVAFQLTVPNYINPPLESGVWVAFTCAQLDSSTNCGENGVWAPDAVFFSQDVAIPAFSAIISFNAADDVGYVFDFPAGAFDSPGVYSAYADAPWYSPGTLTVTTTPEPSTMLLVLSALSLFGLHRLLVKRSTAF